MHPLDVMRYGHLTLMASLDGLPPDAWSAPRACGVWTIKDVVAHLAASEEVLAAVFAAAGGASEEPALERYLAGGAGWNDAEVAARATASPAAVVAEYERWHGAAMSRAATLSPDTWRHAGVLAWYGAEYDLEDYIAYGVYGHKREHAAQIHVARDRSA